MSKAYEQLKRSMYLKEQRIRAEGAGVTLRPSGPGYASMVGTRDDGSVWVWQELTGELSQVAPAGTVDVSSLPEQTPRGTPVGKGF